MGGEGKRQAAHRRGIARDRAGCVHEVGVEPHDGCGGFGSQHQGLAETANPVGGAVAAQVAPPQPPRRTVARQPPRRLPAAQQAQRLLVEIFGQIQNRRANFAVDRVGRRVGRPAQRDNADIEPAFFERANLLRDKGLGESGISLEDERDRPGHR